MTKNCVPYPRKSLYLVLTIPMIAIYLAIAVLLWQVNQTFFMIYLSLFLIVVVSQSYVCVYWQCPYIGKFAPCVGGFCLPSSQVARLFKNVKRSVGSYNVVVTLAFAAFLGIIVLPIYFLYQQGIVILLVYLGIVLIYAASFLWWICPVCGTRHVCPGGQTSTKLREAFIRK
ncbi:MAG: hypothetical protein JW730_02530 [Anaerolineales bacterium]|nr:hypothetical protein [Anaerolineales bacterium]